MANTIRIKRRAAGGVLGAPSGLANAELAYNEGDNILYYGFGTGGVGGTATQAIPIAGSGAYLNKNNNLSDLNNTQTSRNNLAGGTVTSGLFMRGNGTNVLMGSIIASDVPTLNQNTTGNAGTVTNGVYTGRTLTAGSGIAGGGDLSADRTFNIGQGDGITVSADAIAVDNTMVRTTGDQSISGVKTFKQDVYLDSHVQFQGTGINGNSLYLDYDSGGSVGFRTEILGQNPFGAWKNKTLIIENGTVGNITLEAHFGKINLWGPSGVNMDAGASSSSGTNFATFVDYSSGNGIIKTRTAAQVKSDIGLGNVTDHAQIKKLASSTNGNIPIWNGTSGDALSDGYSVQTTLSSSSTAIPRADAVKTYVDSAITSGIATNDAMIFKGALDCSTNPNYPAGDRGWVYKISVAGRIGGASGPVVEVNDTIICGTDGTPSGAHGGVHPSGGTIGSYWTILQTNIADASILVTGPSSATSGNFALFDGNTGKILKDSGFDPTTVVRTTGTQTINGSKTFGNGISIGDPVNYLTGTALIVNFSDGGQYLASFVNGTTYANSSIKLNANTTFNLPDNAGDLPFIINPTGYAGSGAVTQGFWRGSTIEVNKGGTGQSSYAIGDLLYANTTTSLAKLANVATGNVLLAGGVSTAPLWGKVGLTTHVSGTLPVANGGTNQTSYTSGQLLIGNSSNTLTKATLTEGSNVTITNGNGTITISSTDTNTATAADDILDGSNTGTQITYAPYATNQAASATPRFYNTNNDPSGSGRLNVSAYFYATRLFDNGSRVVTAATICSDAGNCTWDGGDF